MPQPAWLVYGPPGCGKTTWILNQVRQARKKLYHWNARMDRSLREGRETLHRQVRSQEPLFVWIEGADDLTPEAQAFLRRILETASPSVQCVLECRDPQRIPPAIQSRCSWSHIANTRSFRKQAQAPLLEKFPQTPVSLETSCRSRFLLADQPTETIRSLLHNPELWQSALLSLRSVGGGSSPWAHLYSLQAQAACLGAAAPAAAGKTVSVESKES